MKAVEDDQIRQQVRDSYSKVANAAQEGSARGVESSCCGVPSDLNTLDSTRLGYSEKDIGSVPEGADMGLGCGNPNAIASIQTGETVLDLGSGGGFDCFLALQKTGSSGQVIGVDMTPAMLSKARSNAEKGNYRNVEFRLGEIEHLPLSDNSVDVIISNCVINLSPNKQQVFNDCFRVLKTGGRLAISDVVASQIMTDKMKQDLEMYSACMSGASSVDDLMQMLKNSGFTNIEILPKDSSKEFIQDWAPGKEITEYVLSASITAVKPVSGKACC